MTATVKKVCSEKNDKTATVLKKSSYLEADWMVEAGAFAILCVLFLLRNGRLVASSPSLLETHTTPALRRVLSVSLDVPALAVLLWLRENHSGLNVASDI